MVLKNLCVLALRTKVASALEGLNNPLANLHFLFLSAYFKENKYVNKGESLSYQLILLTYILRDYEGK